MVSLARFIMLLCLKFVQSFKPVVPMPQAMAGVQCQQDLTLREIHMSIGAVIVAAGRGSRLGDERGPKQYRQLGHTNVLQRTLDRFTAHSDIDRVVVVIHGDDRALYENAVRNHDKLEPAVMGGASRQASCHAGIKALEQVGVEQVLIHDAARPFVSSKTISNVIAGIEQRVGALPATAIADTVKKVDGGLVETLSREGLFLAQTPQGFHVLDIAGAHRAAISAGKPHGFTDDAAVAEWHGIRVKLVEGNRENFKITTLDDLQEAHAMVGDTLVPDVRTATGYDTHNLGPGNGVILCGVHIEHDKSLQGHSDADVGLHALTDALLGLVGEGDIGSHFPPNDNRWKGAASDRFLAHAIHLVRSAGGTITNLDVTLICESPKIGPHRNVMRRCVADIAGIELNRVSVKATTNEKVGFIGRGEGIAALATATGVFGSMT